MILIGAKSGYKFFVYEQVSLINRLYAMQKNMEKIGLYRLMGILKSVFIL